MIPFTRSLSELMELTESRSNQKYLSKYKNTYISTLDSGRKRRCSTYLNNENVSRNGFYKTIRHKLMQNKGRVSKFIKNLNYNNQIQSSIDLTLIERKHKRNQKNVA